MSGYKPAKGDRVRARRYVQPPLASGDPAREFQFERTGTAAGPYGMTADDGEYIGFSYVFLGYVFPGGNPADRTCSYLVTEVEPEDAR